MLSNFPNTSVTAITVCVPAHEVNNHDLNIPPLELDKIIQNSGIQKRRIANSNTSASDLCINAATDVFKNTNVEKETIAVFVFVTQYPDYILPSTAHIIKHKLGLHDSCFAIQINEGCSGYGYGMQVACSLLQSVNGHHALLLVGDTTSKVIDENNQATSPLFGDAGSATLISTAYNGNISIESGSDGKGYKDIIVEKGFREMAASKYLKMDGMNVFMFGISRVPKYIEHFLQNTTQAVGDFDFVVLHQANKMMNERVIRKLGIDENKALYSLENFGNTSNASIPLTLVLNLKNIVNSKLSILACGFGVGLSWATMSFKIDSDTKLNLIEYNHE